MEQGYALHNALKRFSGENMTAREIAHASLTIASEICVYTNSNIILEEL